jgi:hydrogenase maturation protease
MMQPRILIACVGNIFLGDDAFGVEVAKRLGHHPLPPAVRVIDFGIRGLDLTYALLDGYEVAILVDAAPRGEAPGTLSVIEPDPIDQESLARADIGAGDLLIETHGMHPAKVLRLVATMGGQLKHVLVVACEPTPFDPEGEMQMSLSPPVEAAVGEAVNLLEALVAKILAGEYEPFLASNPPTHSSKGEVDHGHALSTH